MLLVKGRPGRALKVQGGSKAWSHTPRTSVGDSGLASGVGEGVTRDICSLGGSKVAEAPWGQGELLEFSNWKTRGSSVQSGLTKVIVSPSGACTGEQDCSGKTILGIAF